VEQLQHERDDAKNVTDQLCRVNDALEAKLAALTEWAEKVPHLSLNNAGRAVVPPGYENHPSADHTEAACALSGGQCGKPK